MVVNSHSKRLYIYIYIWEEFKPYRDCTCIYQGKNKQWMKDLFSSNYSTFKGRVQIQNIIVFSCLNFWDEACWFLSLRFFRLLSSSLLLLLFPQRFGRYVLRPSSGVCRTRGTFAELRTTSFIETTGVACSDSVCHNRVQVLIIPVYYSPVVRIEPATFRWLSSLEAQGTNALILNTCTRLWQTESEQATPVVSIKDVVRSSVKVPEFDKHLKKAGGHIGRNVVEIPITIKMMTIVRKSLMIKYFFLFYWIVC